MRWIETAQLGLVLVLFGTMLGLVLALLHLPTFAFWALLVLIAWFAGPAVARWVLRR